MANSTAQSVTAYIALGSNLGDSMAMLDRALAGIGELAEVELLGVSDVIETVPQGGPAGQRYYLNAAADLSCRMPAAKLLEELLAIEDRLGRVRAGKNGPRCIDLDLLLYGDAVIDQPGLIVPHPRMHERSFVMVPLAQIAGGAVHPVLNRTMTELLAELKKANEE